jgi:hypothetical protein
MASSVHSAHETTNGWGMKNTFGGGHATWYRMFSAHLTCCCRAELDHCDGKLAAQNEPVGVVSSFLSGVPSSLPTVKNYQNIVQDDGC